MAQSVFSLALGSASWPMLTKDAEQQVLIQRGELPLLPNKESSQARPIYMHNVLPSAQGLHSVGFTDVIPALTPAATDFDRAVLLRDSGENRVLFSPAAGKNYVYLEGIGNWRSVDSITPATTDIAVSFAYIHQRTFICYPYLGIYEYSANTDALVAQTVQGLNVAQIKGIASANNFLLAYTDDTLYMSSMVDLLDFTPSLASGAGSVGIQELRGNIIAVLPLAGSIIVYTTYNAVGGQYSGNLRFPFVFKEIKGSGGITTAEHVTWGTTSDVHYAWTSFGLQVMNVTTSQVIFPEVADFLTSKLLEDFDDGSQALTLTSLTDPVRVKLTWVASRWLCISYGAAEFTHALVLDLVLQRWGKLKITHVDCFNYYQPNIFTPLDMSDLVEDFQYYTMDFTSLTNVTPADIQPKQDFAFLIADGTVRLLDFSVAVDRLDTAALLFGKLSLLRNHRTLMHGYEVTGAALAPSSNFDTKVLASDTGASWARTTVPHLKATDAQQLTYLCTAQGKTLSLQLTGTFNLSQLTVTLSVGGK